MKRLRTLGGAGITLVAATILAPAVMPARAQQKPTFQTTVNVVDVDVTVKDAQGNFVAGLAADDFEVLEDGRPQTIQTFSYIELPAERPDRFRFSGVSVPADVRSN